jgi:energy-coupling factor transporter ATP-binding protein EcfA2
MTAYRIHAIRLVNFHNFVDETVEVRDGGHLFLLGDNGAGKTTVLDAVHYVLAGGELELNAAARIGGRRDDSRTLQGIVLRYDLELGVRNEGGAIAYAVVELAGEGEERLCLGIGTEATTLEAKVTRWAFIVRRPLREIALLDHEDRPIHRDTLRRELGQNAVFAHMTPYRKEIARRLFGSERQYEDAVRFWGMAKAYREIVATARDFGTLFQRLLPTPDTAVFAEILRTLRAIDDLELAVRDLVDQASYVRGLADLAREVAVQREAATRYHWLELTRLRDETLEKRADELAEVDRGEALVARLDGEADGAQLAARRADESLRLAEHGDAAALVSAVRDCEARRAEVENDASRAALAVRDAERDRAAALRIAMDRKRDLVTAAAVAASAIAASSQALAELPGELAPVRELEAVLHRIATAAGAVLAFPDIEAAAECASEVGGRVRERLVAAKVAAAEARRVRDAAAARVTELEASVDPIAVEGLDRARQALASAGIAARPLYELLEPTRDADPRDLAAIEALATAEALASLVVAPSQIERARRLISPIAPAVRVVVKRAELELPAWCANALAGAPPTALAALAAILHQPAEIGDVASMDAERRVEIRGLGFQLASEAPRWLGVEARQHAREQQLSAARSAHEAAAAHEADALRAVRAAEVLIGGADRLARALSLVDGPVARSWQAAMASAQRGELADRGCHDAERRRDELGARLGAIDDDLAALHARTAGSKLEELEKQLASLRSKRDRAAEEWRRALEASAEAMARVRAGSVRIAEADARTAELDARLAETSRVLRARLASIASPLASAGDEELAHYVRVTQRGDSFRTTDAIRHRVVEAERAAEVAAAELDNDGSRGVRSLAYAARFGFTYDRERNQIADRRAQPIAGVLADLERTIEEQLTVVNERTRKLMDELIMSELARHLQHQIYHLHEMIKGINRVLKDLRFGASAYKFEVAERPDRAELIELVRRLSILDEDSRVKFRAWIDAHLDELRVAEDGDEPPELLDYRKWFEFKLRMSTTGAEGVELTHALRRVGSGGEQGVPNYLLVLSLGKLMFDAAGAAVRPLLFDEAFYGIDAGRRDQLLRLATDLGLQLVVASPDQDGVTKSIRHATTLFVVKDVNHDIHLAPYHYWNDAVPQPGLFDPAPPEPDEAICHTS